MSEKARVRNAADPKQVANAKLHDQFTEENRVADMRAVLSTPEGRRVLWWWLSQAGLFESITVTSSEIYVRSGKRDLGLALIAAINVASPEAYLLMQREAAKLEELKESAPDTSEDAE